MNDDLISRAALLEFAHNHIGGRIDCNDIARFPAMAIELVRHGRWDDELKCTVCGIQCIAYKLPDDKGTIYIKTPCCPNCGAKMDGGFE